MKKKRKDNIIKLCSKYSTNCKRCPRNKKCEEEMKMYTRK